MSGGMGVFYEGIIDYGHRDPDYEGVAAAVNFLRSNDVMIDIGRAHVRDGAVRLPFIVKEPESRIVSLGVAGGAREECGRRSVLMVRQLFEGHEVSFRKAIPTVDNAQLLKACTKLTAMSPDDEPVDADDFTFCNRRANVRVAGADASARREDADPFDGLVGMDAQKRLLRQVVDTVARYGRDVLSSCHMAFIGDPGTGKTEFARRLLDCFDRAGVTDGRGTFVKADAAGLIGRYVGETPHLVSEKVRQAEGGLLFIDEAYRLADTGQRQNPYGREAVDTLVEMLESHRSRFVCVLAGYPAPMESLFETNPGLRDRIGFRVQFPDFDIDELCEIFSAFARERGFGLSEDAGDKVRCACSKITADAGFANARSVRRLFERTVIKQCHRQGSGDGSDRVGSSPLNAWDDAGQGEGTRGIICGEDVMAALGDDDMNGVDHIHKNPVGFVVRDA